MAEHSTVRPLVELRDLSVSYDRTMAIQGVSGSLMPNSLTALVGPNGGGKSTLLKTLQGFIKPAKGSILWVDHHTRTMSYLPQLNELDRSFPLIVEEVVGMGLWPQIGPFRKASKVHMKLIQDSMKRVGIPHLKNRLISELSGGQFQRMLFARIILQDASLIILDEPFSGVDATTAESLLELIQDWHRDGKTVMVVLHDLELVQKYFPETLLIARQCIGWGKTSKVLTKANIKKAFYEFCC
jgi:zinc/manganese transport system ATP-binding protein